MLLPPFSLENGLSESLSINYSWLLINNFSDFRSYLAVNYYDFQAYLSNQNQQTIQTCIQVVFFSLVLLHNVTS